MTVAREPVRFNEHDDDRTTIAKLNRLVDELYTKLAAAELRVSQVFKFTKDPTISYVLTCDADGDASWAVNPVTEPGGSDTHVQFNDAGEFGGDSGMSYIKGTGTLTVAGDLAGVNEYSGTSIDLSGNGDIDGTLDVHGLATLDGAKIDGTETDELIDMSRTIDAEVTKPGVTLHETRTGVVVSGSTMNGFEYKSTIDATVYTAGHNGFYSEIDHDAGSMAVGYPFCAKLASASGTTKWGMFAGLMALDGVSFGTVPAVRSGIALDVKGSAATAIYGAFTQASNAGTGIVYGYQGSGTNTYGSAATTVNAYGVYGYATSAHGLAVGLYGQGGLGPSAKTFGIHSTDHNWFDSGNTYIRDSTSITTVLDAMTDLWDEGEDGNLYVENHVEIGGALQVGSTATLKGDVKIETTNASLVVGPTSYFYLKNMTAPASATAAGAAGQFMFDGSHIYCCVATSTWKRAALSTWS